MPTHGNLALAPRLKQFVEYLLCVFTAVLRIEIDSDATKVRKLGGDDPRKAIGRRLRQ